MLTTLISREKLSKKIWVKNSWKCWGSVKIEFVDNNLTFRIVWFSAKLKFVEKTALAAILVLLEFLRFGFGSLKVGCNSKGLWSRSGGRRPRIYRQSNRNNIFEVPVNLQLWRCKEYWYCNFDYFSKKCQKLIKY